MIEINKKLITTLAEKYIPQIKKIRHHIHSNPELGFNEFKTSNFIRSKLKELNIETLPPFLKTDTVAFLNRDKKQKNITFRADIDALPITEKSENSYSSSNTGVMHACGHDGHTAMLLGAVMALNEIKESLNGSVRFVFQPAEEGLCGGKALIEAGAVNEPKPGFIFGFHGWPGLKVGQFMTIKGPMTSGCDTFKIKIIGKGAHSSTPEAGIDPILTSAKIIEAFDSIASKNFSPIESVLVSVCTVHSGTTSNIIPDNAELEGTVRYFKPEHGTIIKEKMEKIISSLCSISGASYEFEYQFLYIPTVNNSEAVDFSQKVCSQYFDNESFKLLEKPAMVSEDFSFFIKDNPGAFMALGLGENSPGLHTCSFDFNDEALINGVKMFCALAIEFLK